MNETDKHIMIDIETLGTRSNAVILSVGAVEFDLKDHIEAVMHKVIDIDSCLQAGLQVDNSTVRWWMQQDKINIDKLMSLPSVELSMALRDLRVLAIDKYVWSHGSVFDIAILDNAYRAVGMLCPWNYKNVRDTRTLFDVAEYKYVAKGGHDALEDAMNQAKAVQEAYWKIMSFVV